MSENTFRLQRFTWRCGLVGAGCAILFGVFLPRNAQAEPRQPPPRKELAIGESPLREHGKPLTRDDFLGEIPDELPPDLQGQTKGHVEIYAYISIRYEFRASFGREGNQVTATLTELRLYSAIDRKQSWLDEARRPVSTSLLDYVQGQFDLVELESRKAQQVMAARLKGGSLIRGKGKDQNAAIVDLQKQIDKDLQPFHERAMRARIAYAKVTDHGRRSDRVKAERRRHHQMLKSTAGGRES